MVSLTPWKLRIIEIKLDKETGFKPFLNLLLRELLGIEKIQGGKEKIKPSLFFLSFLTFLIGKGFYHLTAGHHGQGG